MAKLRFKHKGPVAYNGQKKKVSFIRILVLGIFVLAIWRFVGKLHNASDKKPSDVQNATVVPVPTVPSPMNMNTKKHELTSLIHIVKPGDTFFGILSKYEVPSENALSCINSLKPIGLPALYPGDSMVIKIDRRGNVHRFDLLSRMQNWYRVHSSDTIFQAEKQEVPITTYRCLINGTLESSLAEEMYKLGISDIIAAKLTDIFAWDINFFLDPRKGDTFQILFERKYAEGRFIGYGKVLAARYKCNGKDFYAIGHPDSSGRLIYYTPEGKSVQKKFLKAPLRYSRISSGFTYNRKHPILGIVRPHLGIDYAAPRGTPVYAAADGTVTFSGRKGGYGKYIVLSHGASYSTHYGHLHTIAKGIRKGARVRQSQCIGTVGSTGLSTGPHLDYRMKIGNKFTNPLTIALPPSEGIDEKHKKQFDIIKETCLTAFELRFASRNGYHILDIARDETKPSTIKKVSHTANDDTESNS